MRRSLFCFASKHIRFADLLVPFGVPQPPHTLLRHTDDKLNVYYSVVYGPNAALIWLLLNIHLLFAASFILFLRFSTSFMLGLYKKIIACSQTMESTIVILRNRSRWGWLVQFLKPPIPLIDCVFYFFFFFIKENILQLHKKASHNAYRETNGILTIQ